jgi:uncharacterized membrane protein
MLTDFISTSIWWGMFFLVGVSFFPTTYLLLGKLSDAGYSFAKIAGAIFISYSLFILGIVKIAPFTQITILSTWAIFTLINIYIFKKRKKEIVKTLRDKKSYIVTSEILFIFGLFFWAYIRAHQPDIRGLEKFMDYGFINSIMRSRYLPPADMWFAGNSINYYWFGHFIVATLSKLSNLATSITYNLGIATILGLALSQTFSLISSLAKSVGKSLNNKSIILVGLISAIVLSFGGNFHTPYFVLKNGSDRYWYPDATRFIGYNPDVDDKTIHEFPLYSYVVSDLHAHLINLPIVILYLSLLWTFLSSAKPARTKKNRFRISASLESILPNLSMKDGNRFAYLLSLGFLLGIMFITNTWDFGNYLLTTGISLSVFLLIKKGGFRLNHIVKSAVQITKYLILILGTASVVLFPFVLNFTSLAEGVKLVHSHSPLWQLSILWGFPAILTVFLVCVVRLAWPRLKKADLFVVSMFLASWILILIPEILYVKDIYISSHYRANTMFKLTYQAFVMTYLSSAYVIFRLLNLLKKGSYVKILSLLSSVLIFLVLIYPYFAIRSYYGNLAQYKGLKGDTWINSAIPEQAAAIKWFNENVSDQPVILESNGDSYTDYNVISSYTGLPTVSGWFVHEWLWRGDSTFPQNRVNDITQIYTSTDNNLTKRLLNKYDVRYVIVGPNERSRYPNLVENKFVQIGSKVFAGRTTSIYQVMY